MWEGGAGASQTQEATEDVVCALIPEATFLLIMIDLSDRSIECNLLSRMSSWVMSLVPCKVAESHGVSPKVVCGDQVQVVDAEEDHHAATSRQLLEYAAIPSTSSLSQKSTRNYEEEGRLLSCSRKSYFSASTVTRLSP